MKVYVVEEFWYREGMWAEDHCEGSRIIGVFQNVDDAMEECHRLAAEDHGKKVSEIYDEESEELVGWYSGVGEDEEGYPLIGDHSTWKVRPFDVQ